MASTSETSARPADQLSVLCGELAAVFRLRWGRGPAKTFAQWAGRDVLIVLMENGHTESEKTLRAAGHIQQLVGGRQLLQALVEDDLTEIAERVLGRRVVTVLSATRLDPDLSAEIFILEPGGRSADAEDDSPVARATRALAEAGRLAEESRALAAEREQIERRHARRETPDT